MLFQPRTLVAYIEYLSALMHLYVAPLKWMFWSLLTYGFSKVSFSAFTCSVVGWRNIIDALVELL